MKLSSFACVLSSIIVVSNFAFAVDGQGHQLSSETSTSLGPAASKMVFAQSSTPRRNQAGSERSIIIVSGKTAKSGSVGPPGSKVMLNPQPLPPKTKVTHSIKPVTQNQSGSERSIIIVSGKTAKSGSVGPPGSKVMLNPQPLPPKAR